MSNAGFDAADSELMMVHADEARARLRSAAEDVDVAKVRDCGGVGLACCRARSVVARARAATMFEPWWCVVPRAA